MQLTQDVIAQLSELPTGNVADSCPAPCVMDSAIQALDPTSHVIGRALPVRCSPRDNLALYQGIDAARPGDVLVFDVAGFTQGGHFGDMMATACKVKGIAGAVIDGSCRDRQDIVGMGFPVFARACCPATTVKETLATPGATITCGGVTVRKGDLVIGDCDGVVVVPAELEDEVIAHATEKHEREGRIRERLLAGEPILEIYGFDALIARKRSA